MRIVFAAPILRRRAITAALAWIVLITALTMPVSPADAVPDETYADDFSPADWNGSDGTLFWADPWTEDNESDGIGAGTIRIGNEPNCPTDPCLLLGRDAGGYASAIREADLTGYATAQLEFDYTIHRHNPGAGSVALWISATAGPSWTQLATWDLRSDDVNSATFDITDYIGPRTAIRFSVYDSTDDSHMNVDNVVITAGGRQGYFDEFPAPGWTGSTGSIDWSASPWVESEGDNWNSGLTQVISNAFCASGNCLRIEGSASSPNHSIVRQVDLSGSTFASLLFNYRRENYNTCSVQLDISNNGGGSWAPLATYGNNGGDPSQQSEAIDIYSHAAVNTQIRFSADGLCTPGEFFYADNVWVYTDATPAIQVLISEYSSRGDDWVELYNAGTLGVDIDGFTLAIDGEPDITIDQGGGPILLPPGGHYLLAEVGSPVGADQPFPFAGGLSSNIGFRLRDDTGALMDEVGAGTSSWGEGTSLPEMQIGPTQSYERLNGDSLGNCVDTDDNLSDFVHNYGHNNPQNMADAAVPCDTPTPASQVVISEFRPWGPAGDDDEFVELFNPTADPVDISGWIFHITEPGLFRDYHVVPGGTVLDPGEHYLLSDDDGPVPNDAQPYDVATNYGTGFGDVVLKNAIGTVVDVLGYGSDNGQMWEGSALPSYDGGTDDRSYVRRNSGYTDTDDNLSDFVFSFVATPEAGTRDPTQPPTFYAVAGSGGAGGGDDLATIVDPIDPDPSSNESSIGVGTGTSGVQAAAWDPFTSTLYAVDGDRLGTIDTATGAFSALGGVIGSGDGTRGSVLMDDLVGLAFHPATGDLYGAHRRAFTEGLMFKIDTSTGAIRAGEFGGDDYVVIEPSGLNYQVTDLAFDPTTGQAYVIHVSEILTTFELSMLDPFTGSTNLIGSVASDLRSLDFDSEGRAWTTTASGSAPEQLHELDKSSGTILWSIDLDNGANYEALAIPNPVPTNQPPTFDQDLLDRSDAEGALISIASPATDPDIGDNLIYGATGLPDGISIDTGSGDVTGALGPSSAGTHNVTITVTDDGTPSLQDTDSFTWTVTSGEPAYLVAAEGGGVGGNEALLTTVDLSDNNPATNETTIGTTTGRTNNEGLAVQPSTGILFASHGEQIGTIDTTTGLFSSLSSAAGIGNGSVGPERFDNIEALSFDFATGDFFAIHRPGTGTTESMLIQIDPATGAHVPNAFGGDDYLEVQAQGSAHQVPGMAHDPTTGTLFIVHWDDIGGEHWYLATLDPVTGATNTVGGIPNDITGLSFSGDGRPYGITDQFSGGTIYEFDKTDASVVSSLMVDNTNEYEAIAIAAVPAPNEAPVFDQDLLDRSDAEGALVNIASPATDPNPGDALTYGAVGLPEGISIDPISGQISGALSANSSGTHAVVVTVTDNGVPTMSDTDSFTWTVTPGEPVYLVANQGGGAGGDDLLTAVDRTDSNPVTNEASIGAGTGTTNIEAAAIQPSTNALFVVEQDRIGVVDVATGVFAPLASPLGTGFGSVGLVTFDNVEGLSFDPSSGELFGTHRRGSSEEDLLILIDPATGAHVPGAFGGDDYVAIQRQGPYYHSADIAHDPTDGSLYVIHWDLVGVWTLATLDPVSGATATIGTMPDDVAGLAFDESGRLNASTETGLVERLHEIDTSTGASLGSIVIDNGSGYEALAIAYPASPNRPPAFSQDLLDRSDAEGTVISLAAGATDPDLHNLTYTATELPPGLSIDPGSGLITGTIDFTAQATSPYSVTITVTDDGIPNLSADDTFIWTVTETNRPPVFDQDLLDRSDAEGTVISLSAAATDPDAGDAVTYGASGLPPGLLLNVFTGDITGTVDYTAAAGSPYSVTITASDDRLPPAAATPDTFTWTVTNTNRPPAMVNPGPQTTPELAAFTLVVTASDPDGTVPSITDSGTLPAWATLTDNADGTATIAGTPGIGDSGTTTVTVTASDGLLTNDAVFDITVTNTNVAPIIVNPGDQPGNEGSPFTAVVTASDPDGTTVSFTDSGTLPAWATLTDNGDDTATISGTPDYDDAGTTTVTITASDGDLTDDAVFDIIIANTNRMPVVNPIADQTVAEGDALVPVVASASDPDGTIPALLASGLPAWASFVDNGDGTGTITGTPGYTDAATTTVTVRAFDGSLIGTTEFDLIVTDTNRAPALNPISDQTVAEGTALTPVTATATDPDGTFPALAASGLPGWASLVDNGDGTGTITGTPGYADAGLSTVTIYAEDGGTPNLSDTTTFDINVTNTNRAPVLNPIPDQFVAEGSALTPVGVIATDPDGTSPTLTATGLPGWASLVDNGDGTGTITGTPGYTDAGLSTVTITAEDGGTPNLSDTTTFDLTVTNTNRAPVLNPIPDQAVAEETAMTPLTITANDPDGTVPVLSETGLPGWASFVDNGDGTATVTGTPGPADSGASTVTVTATDGFLIDTKSFDITVTDENLPPSFDHALPDRTDAEGDSVVIDAGATDPNGDTPTYSAVGLPPGIGINTATGEISGTLPYGAAGIYAVTITAVDDATPATATATAQFTWTVIDTNRPPVLGHIASVLGPELIELGFTATATDPDGDPVTYAIAGAPAGAAIDPITGVFTWTPQEVHGTGSYAITVIATDTGVPAGSDTKTVTITVTEVNSPPVIDPIGDQTSDPGDSASLTVVAIDPDLPQNTLSYSATGLPPGLTIDSNGLISGTIAGYATGQFEVEVTVTDDGTPAQHAKTTFQWVVDDGANEPPNFDAIADRTVAEGTTLTVRASAADPDGDSIEYAMAGAPEGSTFDPVTGTLRWTPTEEQGPGTYRMSIIAADDGAPPLVSVRVFTVTVEEVNQAPTIEPIPDRVDDALTAITLPTTASDPDLPVNALTYAADGLPPGLAIDPTTGVIIGQIEAEAQGITHHAVTITVSDDGDPVLDASMSFTWTVVAPEIEPDNFPPSVEPITAQYSDAGSAVELQVSARDTEPLVFSATGLPLGLTIDPTTGMVAGTVEESAVGTHSVVITVTEERETTPLSTSVAFAWTVTDRDAAEQKEVVVVSILGPDSTQSGDDGATAESRPLRRGLVVMSSAAAATTESLRLPFLLLLALMAGFATVGRIGLYPLLWRGDRHTGTISYYDPELSFGLIKPDDGGEDVFVHAHAFPRKQRALVAGGMRLKYRVLAGDNRSNAWGASLEVGDE